MRKKNFVKGGNIHWFTHPNTFVYFQWVCPKLGEIFCFHHLTSVHGLNVSVISEFSAISRLMEELFDTHPICK